MTESTNDDDVSSRQANPHECPECGSYEADKVDMSEVRLGNEIIHTFSCQSCYAGWTVEYAPVGKEVTITAEEAKQ